MRLFAAILLFQLASLPLLRGSLHPSPESPKVYVTHETQVIWLDRNDPQAFRISLVLVFSWNPKELPGFDITSLDFLNRAYVVDQRIEKLPPRLSDGFVGVLVAARGVFECSNDFTAYPFNIARFPVIFRVSEYKGKPVNLVNSDIPYRHAPEQFCEADGFIIKSAQLMEGNYYETWADQIQGTSNGDVYAAGVIIDAEHRPSRTFLMVFIPLLLIWGVVYSSLWWKEESACSRAIMASLFAATALAFSSINLQPNVSYITSATVAFTLLYLNLASIGVFTVLASRAHKVGQMENYRRWREVGRIVAGLLLTLSLLLIICWVIHFRGQPLLDWFNESRKMPLVPPSVRNSDF
jgi:hypothetical protein